MQEVAPFFQLVGGTTSRAAKLIRVATLFESPLELIRVATLLETRSELDQGGDLAQTTPLIESRSRPCSKAASR